MRRITWKFWVFWGILIGGYFGVGTAYAYSTSPLELWLYRIGLSSVTVIAFLFVIAYTAIGVFLPHANRWWKTDAGSSIVMVTAAMVPSFGSLAWVFDFDNGSLHPGWLAWVALNGPLLLTASLAWRSYVWTRLILDKREEDSNAH